MKSTRDLFQLAMVAVVLVAFVGACNNKGDGPVTETNSKRGLELDPADATPAQVEITPNEARAIAKEAYTKDKPALMPDDAKAKQAYAIGVQAYIWGYPMVVMQKSRDAMTKGGDAPVTPEQFNKSGLLFAPVNQVANAWGHARAKILSGSFGKQ